MSRAIPSRRLSQGSRPPSRGSRCWRQVLKLLGPATESGQTNGGAGWWNKGMTTLSGCCALACSAWACGLNGPWSLSGSPTSHWSRERSAVGRAEGPAPGDSRSPDGRRGAHPGRALRRDLPARPSACTRLWPVGIWLHACDGGAHDHSAPRRAVRRTPSRRCQRRSSWPRLRPHPAFVALRCRRHCGTSSCTAAPGGCTGTSAR